MLAGALGRTPALAASTGFARNPQFPNTSDSSRSSVRRNENTRDRCASTRCIRGGGTIWGRSAEEREPKIVRDMQHTPFPANSKRANNASNDGRRQKPGHAEQKRKDTLQSNAVTKPTSRSASTGRNRQRTVLHLFPRETGAFQAL